MTEPRKVAIVIGVADAEGAPYLGGALNGARAFADWARALKYETTVITDELAPVTFPLLKEGIETALAAPAGETDPSAPIGRLVLYFAGHGLIREAEEGLWLLSNWSSEARAVAVEPLRRRLYRYDVAQIAIFADACRSLPSNLDTADLTPDAVLGRGPLKRPGAPWIDKFIAAQDDAVTLMIPGDDPKDDRCVFSGVLMQALWGAAPAAFSQYVVGAVTSSSLGAYLRSEVSAVARAYDREILPNVAPGFPETDNVYLRGSDGVAAPALKPWPPKTKLTSLAPSPPPFATSAPSPASYSLGFQVAVPDALDTAFHRPSPSFAPSDQWAAASVSSSPLDWRLRNQHRPTHYESQCGLAVEGGEVVAGWSLPDVQIDPDGPGWFRLDGAPLTLRNDGSAPLLLRFADGLWFAGAAMSGFILSAIREEAGVAGMVYRPVWGGDSGRGATEVIGRLEAGTLRGEEARDLAVKLRREKHSDPVLAVVCAYLYDALGDLDSVRQMAFFFAQRSQPIPYDLVLLAQLEVRRLDGRLLAQVPGVRRRTPLSAGERDARWSYEATEAVAGAVGGCWPWMRQGWAFLEEAIDDRSPLVCSEMLEVRALLTPSRFTTLRDGDAVGALAAALGLRRCF